MSGFDDVKIFRPGRKGKLKLAKTIGGKTLSKKFWDQIDSEIHRYHKPNYKQKPKIEVGDGLD